MIDPATKDSGKAWVTLLTKTSYLQGCLVLHHSLERVQSKYPLVVFATPTLPEEARAILGHKGIRVRDIKYIDPPKSGKELDEHDQRFHDTWTKLRCFEMAEYDVSFHYYYFYSLNVRAELILIDVSDGML